MLEAKEKLTLEKISNMEPNELFEKLKESVHSKFYTFTEDNDDFVAKNSKISQTSISEYRNGHKLPGTLNLCYMAAEMNMPINELLNIEEPESKLELTQNNIYDLLALRAPAQKVLNSQFAITEKSEKNELRKEVLNLFIKSGYLTSIIDNITDDVIAVYQYEKLLGQETIRSKARFDYCNKQVKIYDEIISSVIYNHLENIMAITKADVDNYYKNIKEVEQKIEEFFVKIEAANEIWETNKPVYEAKLLLDELGMKKI